MKSIFGLLVGLLFLIAGCHPHKHLIVENKYQNPENQIVISLKEFDSKNQDIINVFTLEKDSLVVGIIYSQTKNWERITIRPNEENIIVLDFSSQLKSEELLLEFGVGKWTGSKWSGNALKSFANIIDTFCITKQSEIICLKAQEDIFKLLLENFEDNALTFEL